MEKIELEQLYKEYLELKGETELSFNVKIPGHPCKIQQLDLEKILKRHSLSNILVKNLDKLELNPAEIHDLRLDAGQNNH